MEKEQMIAKTPVGGRKTLKKWLNLVVLLNDSFKTPFRKEAVNH